MFLGNSPWTKPGFIGVRAGCRWPHFELGVSPYMPFPFFLGYAAALLKKNGFEVMLVDAIAERMDEATYFSRMATFAPDLVVHEVSTASMETDLAHGRLVKANLPQSQLVFCGAHNLMYSSSFLDEHPSVDYVIEGEYEFALLELAQKLYASKAELGGLIYRAADDHAVSNGRRPLAKLDDLPWPAREFLPMNRYWDNQGGIPAPSLQIHASRGCPFTCNFCSWPQLMYGGNKYRTRSPKDVVDEIEWCRGKYGIKSFYFDDDTFNIGKKRILEICDELVRRNLRLPWSVMARADTADSEMLVRMQQAGLVSIKYGVESADQTILDLCGKKLDLSVARQTIQETMRLGINCHLTFTFGLPGETRETISKTMQFADEMDTDSVQFSVATPYPGSRLYEELKARGHLLSENFNEYDGGNRAVVRTDALGPEEIEAALKTAVAHWHKKRFMRKLWRNKFHYCRESLRHPLIALRIIGNALR